MSIEHKQSVGQYYDIIAPLVNGQFKYLERELFLQNFPKWFSAHLVQS